MPWHESVFMEVYQMHEKIVKTPNEAFEIRAILVFNPELQTISEIIDKWRIIYSVKKCAWIGHF